MDIESPQLLFSPDGGRGGFDSSPSEPETLKVEAIFNFTDVIKNLGTVAPARIAQIINLSFVAIGAGVLVGVAPPAALAGVVLSQPARDLIMGLIGEATGGILGKIAEGKNVEQEEIRRYVRVISHQLNDAAFLNAAYQNEISLKAQEILDRIEEMHPTILANFVDLTNLIGDEVVSRLDTLQKSVDEGITHVLEKLPNPHEMPEKFPKLNLYRRPETFLKRDDISEEVASMLKDPNVSIIELCGHPAVGLTELAKQIAYEFKDNGSSLPPQEAFKYILFLSARDESIATNSVIQTRKDDLGDNLNRLLTQISTFYGNSAFGDGVSLEDRTIAVKNACLANNERALFIIDNIDNVDAEVLDFLRYASEFPNIKIIVTGTKSQNLGEAITVNPLGEGDAKQLINQIWQNSNKSDTAPLNLSNTDLQRIYRFTKGLPTVISWVLADMATSEKSIAEIEQDFDRYGQSELAKYCFENVYESLSDDARSVLTALCVFATGATELELTDLAKVTDLSGILTELESLSLIEYSDFGIISLHPITNRYVVYTNGAEFEEQMDEYLTRQDYYRCERAKYFLEYGNLCEDEGDKGAAISSYITGIGYITDSDTHLLDTRYELQKGLGNLQKRSNPAYAIRNLRENLKLVREQGLGEKYDVIRIYNDLAVAYIESGDLQRASEYVTDALNLSKRLGYGKDLSYTYTQLGELFTAQGELEKAVEAYEQSIVQLQESGRGNWSMFAFARSKIAELYVEIGEDEKAIEEYEKVLSPGLADSEMTGPLKYVYLGLSQLYIKNGHYQQAMLLLDSLVEYADMQDMNMLLNQRGEIFYQTSQPAQAIKNFEEALKYSNTKGTRSYTLNNLGKAYLEVGKLGESQTALEEAVEIAEKIGNPKTTAYAKYYLGNIKKVLGNDEEAIVYYRASLEDLYISGDYRFLPNILDDIAKIYQRQNQFIEAAKTHEEGLWVRQDLSHRSRSILYALDKILENYKKAIEIDPNDDYVKKQLETYIFERADYMIEVGKPIHVIGSEYFRWADYYRKSKIDLHAAIHLYQNCIKIDNDTGNIARQISAAYQIAKCHFELGEYKTTIEILQANIDFLQTQPESIPVERTWQDLSLNYLWLARTNIVQGNYSEATNNLLNSIGCQQRERKVTEQIVTEFERLAQIAINDNDVLTAKHNYENALNIYRDELKQQSKVAEIEAMLANLRRQLY